MIQNFSNKNVLVTGGSRGIGRSCAILFADLGANVIITYKTNSREAQQTIDLLSTSGKHKMFRLDICNPDEVRNFINDLLGFYPTLDILVNNAGVYIEHKIKEVSFTEWQMAWNETIATNLTGVSNLCFFAAKQMMDQGQGKIVNISSRGAFRGEPDHPAYGASKAGLNAMSQSLAIALAPYNITVGIVAPGFVETDMAKPFLQGEGGEKIRKQSPLNRVATPEEVARAIVMFSSEGMEFMTGGIIDINGASYLRS